MISRYANQLSGVDNLYPVSKSYAKKHKNELFTGKDEKHALHGIQAIRLKNTASDAKIRFETEGDINVTSNGRTWIYWRLSRAAVRNKKGELGNKAKDAFSAKFPIEVVNELAEEAFAKLDVDAVYLWTTAGRVGDGFSSLRQFVLWMNEHWQAGRYTSLVETSEGSGRFFEKDSDPAAWISGLAIRLKPSKKQRKEAAKEARKRK